MAAVSQAVAGTVGRTRAARDIAGQLVLRAANLVLGVGVTLLVVRALGDDGFGQWSTLFAVSTVMTYFGTLGLERVAVERAAAQPERQAEWVGALLTLQLALGVPVALAMLAVLLLIADGSTMRIAAAIISVLPLGAALASLRVVLQLQVRNTLSTAFEVANGVLWAAFVGVVVLAGAEGLVLLAVGFTAITLLTSVSCAVVAARAGPIRIAGSRARWRPLVRLGLPVGVGGLLVLAYGYIDQVFVFELAGARDAGLYGSVYRIFERIQFLPSTVMVTLFPIIVAARRVDPERARRLFHQALDYLMMMSLPALTIALAGPEAIVRLLFGAEFADAAPALPVLMGGFVVVAVGYLCGYLIIAYELQWRFMAFAAAALVFNVAANLALVPEYGFMAAAWITLATEVLVTGLSLHAVCRALGVVPTGRRLDRIAAAALAVGALGWLLRVAGVPTAAWAVAALAAYPPLLLALRVLDVGELRALARW